MNRNVTATILVVLAIGVYMTFTQAKLAEVTEVRKVNEGYISALENAKKLIDLRDAVLKDYRDLSENDRMRLDKMVPNTVDNIRLIIDLNSIALKNGFAIKNIKANTSNSSKQSASVPAPVQQNPAQRGGAAGVRTAVISTPVLDTVTVSFNVSSTYQQLIDLLRVLESNLRIMDVTRLNVSAGANGIYDYSVELKTYWLRQQ